jgi:hypothetical protein
MCKHCEAFEAAYEKPCETWMDAELIRQAQEHGYALNRIAHAEEYWVDRDRQSRRHSFIALGIIGLVIWCAFIADTLEKRLKEKGALPNESDL